jgi:hypothetical protein
VVALDNTVFLVGEERIFYRGGDVPQAVSDASLSERIERVPAGDVFASTFAWSGHVFYALTIGSEGTFVFDVTTQSWARWRSYGRDAWAGGMVCRGFDGVPICGDTETGTLYRFNADAFTDDGQPLVMIVTGGALIKDQPQVVHSVNLECATGWGADGIVELLVSKDGGFNYGEPLPKSLGNLGQHAKRVRWDRLGMFSPPGAAFRFRISSPVPRRVSGAYINGVR